MNLDAPIERVVALLTTAGFATRPAPLHIGSVAFDFAAVLTSPKALDLLIVIDTLKDPGKRVRQRISGLGNALDLSGSRRPLTVILVGPRLDPQDVDSISRFARTLYVGTPLGSSAEQELRDGLAVLLPLSLPEVASEPEESWSTLRAEIVAANSRDLHHILEATVQGEEAVESAFSDSMRTPLTKIEGP